MEYLPPFTPFLRPSFVGKYTIHGAYGYYIELFCAICMLGKNRQTKYDQISHGIQSGQHGERILKKGMCLPRIEKTWILSGVKHRNG
jgi:hypothetical protein